MLPPSFQLLRTKNLTPSYHNTIPVGVSYMARAPAFGKAITDICLSMAGGTFGALFKIVFFIAFQQYFIRGITIGAVKG